MDPDERLRLDYGETGQLVRTLLDVRFKLLAFIPTIAGAAVALVGGDTPNGAELLGVGILGLLATFGVLLYELANTQVYHAALDHGCALERRLSLETTDDDGPAGLLTRGVRAPSAAARFGQERAVALVYGVALAGWSYLVAWGVLRVAGAGSAREIGAGIGVVLGLLVLVQVDRFSRALTA